MANIFGTIFNYGSGDIFGSIFEYEPIIVSGIYLGQVVCYSQTVVCERTTVRAN